MGVPGATGTWLQNDAVASPCVQVGLVVTRFALRVKRSDFRRVKQSDDPLPVRRPDLDREPALQKHFLDLWEHFQGELDPSDPEAFPVLQAQYPGLEELICHVRVNGIMRICMLLWYVFVYWFQ